MSAGPVAGVLQGHPGEEPLHRHALVPTLLRNVPGLLRTEAAAEKLTCTSPPSPVPDPSSLYTRRQKGSPLVPVERTQEGSG